jgi:hypothetical protein
MVSMQVGPPVQVRSTQAELVQVMRALEVHTPAALQASL